MAPFKKRTPKARSSRKKKTAKLQLTRVAANTDTLHCCLVCFKDQPLSAFPDVGNTGNHDHDNNTCRKCFNRYTVDQIKSGKDEIRCCECAEHLTYDQVKTIISKTSLITYDKVLAKACVESDADFRYCLSEKCKSGQIHVGGAEQPLFNCGACKEQHCANCEVPWHEDETCDQYQARHDDEIVQTAVVLSKISKRCPGGCGARIERDGGCPHMICIKCDLDFCWNCLGDYEHLDTQGLCTPAPQARADSPSDDIKSRQAERQIRKEARQEEDDASEALIMVTTKKCPRLHCGVPITKDGGCDHVTCPNCDTQFCYCCLANYATILKYDNRRHKKHCIYHPSHRDRQEFPTKSDSDEDEDEDESTTAADPRAHAAVNDLESEENFDQELVDNEVAKMLEDHGRARAADKKAVAKKKAAAAASKSAVFTTRRALRSNTLVLTSVTGTVERRIDRTRTRALDRAVRARGI
ncbi:hypothetical protein D6C93_02772 [Aureobasidium pullulans]|nr:hypothetical protein D6C93_02772 [Aureobasidium pullulans]